MSRRSRRAGQLATLALIGLLVVAFPAGFALAQDLADPGATTQSNHTVLPIINLTSTPTETPTATPTQTATPTPTATATPTPTSGGGGDGGGGDMSADGRRLVVDKGSGTAGGVTSLEDCSNAEYTTIQRAVDDAAPGDTVVVCAGDYPESVEIETANLTLQAHGKVVIKSTGQPAIMSTAPGVAISGFTIRTEQTNHMVEVGGRNTSIRNMTINVMKVETDVGRVVGIFLSDGFTAEGNPDPQIGAATRSQIVNSTFEVRAPDDSEPAIGVRADADRTLVRGNAFSGAGNATSIYSSGNKTVIQKNIILYPESGNRGPRNVLGIWIGGNDSDRGDQNISPPDSHDWALQNLIIGNSIQRANWGIFVLAGGEKTLVKDNTISETTGRSAIRIKANQTSVRNNTVAGFAGSFGIQIESFDVRVSKNTISGTMASMRLGGNGLAVRGWFYSGKSYDEESVNNVTINGNIVQNTGQGISVYGTRNITDITIVNNTVTNNTAGIKIDSDCFGAQSLCGQPKENIEVHHNRIWNNRNLGIGMNNNNPADGTWWVLNATHNYWGCGGPSSGLQDPYTNRTANGTGDRISAGDKAGVSNIHFDPFYVRQDVSCPNQTSNPTPTPTASPTPTPTPTPPPGGETGGGKGDDTSGEDGDGDGGGSGGGSGDGEGSGDTTGGESGSGGDQTMPPPTPSSPAATLTATATPPPTPTPTDSPTPTPVVESGFGIATWFIGFFLTAGLLALSRREVRP